MGTKTSYNYGSKNLARQKEANFIIKNYSPKERKNLTAFILPGYDEDSKTSLELTQVLDRVGVRRENVVGVERDPKVYEKLKKADLGIRLYNMSDAEFFKGTRDKFDIISLDYTGKLDEDKVQNLINLFNRDALKSPGLLHTNFYGMREKSDNLELYKIPIMSHLNRLYDASTSALEDSVSLGESEGHLNKMLGAGMIEQQLNDFNLPTSHLRDELSYIPVIVAGPMKVPTFIKANYRNLDEARPMIDYVKSFSQNLEKTMGIPVDVNDFVWMKSSQPYFCKSVERYKYVSDVGSLMITDLFLFEKRPELFDDNKYPTQVVLNRNKEPHIRLSIGDYDMSDPRSLENPFVKNQISHAVNVVGLVWSGFDIINRTPRINLGSSVKRPSLTNKALRNMVFRGEDTDFIREKYNVNENRLKGFKAQYTMEKNAEKIRSVDGLIPISKEEAYKLLENNVSTHDILKKYEIKVETLNAYKAWVTMRRQKEKDEILSRLIPEDLYPKYEKLISNMNELS